MNDKENKPWYKQAWPWFVFSIPFLTVVAGVITYKIASDRPHSMVEDDYFKEGLAINQSIERENMARELGLVANIQIEADSELLLLTLEGNNTDFDSLLITFSHPTQAQHDHTLTLQKLGDREYASQLPELKQALWYILLQDKDQTWLLKTRWDFPANNQVTLQAPAN